MGLVRAKIMKNIWCFLLCLLLTNSVIAQTSLGQTKEYIINQHSDCYIHSNTDYYLLLECNNSLCEYEFGGSSNLCKLCGFELPINDLDSFKTKLLQMGYKYLGNIPQIPLVVTREKRQLYGNGLVYANELYSFTILNCSLDGLHPNLIGVLKELFH